MSLWLGSLLDVPVRATLVQNPASAEMKLLFLTWRELDAGAHTILDAAWLAKKIDDDGDLMMRRFPDVSEHDEYRIVDDIGFVTAEENDDAFPHIVITGDACPVARVVVGVRS